MRARVIVSIVVGLAMVGACFVGALIMMAGGDDTDSAIHSVVESAAAGTESTKPKAKKSSVISGDDVVHVGEDVPAGTYRAAESVAGELCYWVKSRDAEGRDITQNGMPSEGRPQVTLKAGQWFTSAGCPDWVKK